MKIILLGSTGQVGWELKRSLLTLGDVVSVTRKHLDLSDATEVRDFFSKNHADLVVNAAAYTAVDSAESERDLAYDVNGTAVKNLAIEVSNMSAFFVHYSTDYVFDGKKHGPYVEEDVTNPLNVYGASKLVGEQAIEEICDRYLIFRTSWVYSSRGNNFVKTILKLAKAKTEIRVVADQRGTPTSAEFIADASALALRTVFDLNNKNGDLTGTYNLTLKGDTSWYEFAKYVVERSLEMGVDLSLNVKDILPIKTSEYVTAAERPSNSTLDTNKLINRFQLNIPDWRIYVDRVLNQMISS